MPLNRSIMDNTYEICTRWLADTRVQNSAELYELESGRFLRLSGE